MRPWLSRRGQLVMPAMLIFPTLMLFVYLIYETAKLSREKIRHQFALDAAAFVEMTNYSDFLNRTAYVNGAFPMRIFDEGFHDTIIDCDQKADCDSKSQNDKRLWEILYKNGAFPRSASGSRAFTGAEAEWDIEYGGRGAGKNSGPPDMNSAEFTPGVFHILDEDDANHFWINWDDANQVFKLYVQIYQLLGAVEDAQYSVLKRLAADHSFLKKSYYLNTGDAQADGLAQAFDAGMGSFSATPYCHEKFMFFGNRPTGSAFQPWQVWAPDNPVSPPQPMPGCSPAGLFQIMWVDKGLVDRLKGANNTSGSYPGISMSVPWNYPAQNYWNVNFANGALFPNGRPEIHTTISLAGNPSAKVWPHPTPKFQVRQFP